MILALPLLVGCKQEDKVASIALKDYDPKEVIEIPMGDFDFGSRTLVVTYTSGAKKEVTLSSDMIAEKDLFKFYQMGEHSITVVYGEKECVFKISVKRSTFSDLRFPENNVFTYDGKPHTVEVDGDIPANAVVTYPGGNSFTNAGTYDVTAIVSCEGYVSERLSTTVTIERATYDMSDVRFEAKEFVYDGLAHSVEITGTLPEGLAHPIYTINEKVTASAIDAGVYNVKATFVNSDPNYNAIPDMTTTLTILPAEYSVNGVDLVFKRTDGTVIDVDSKVYDGTAVTFDLNDPGKVPGKVSVSFVVYDEAGNVVSYSNKNTNMIDAGVYTVRATFTIADSKNYKLIDPVERTFEVVKSKYDTSAIHFDNDVLVYDGNAHQIFVEIPDGHVIDGSEIVYRYYLNDELVTDADGNPAVSVTNAGRYTVKAIFPDKDKNLVQIADMTATLKIDTLEVDTESFGFSGEASIEYNGNPYVPVFTTWKEGNEKDYDILSYNDIVYYRVKSNGSLEEMGENEYPTEAGSYIFIMMVSLTPEHENNYSFGNEEKNYELISYFRIEKKVLNIPQATFNGEKTLIYSGNENPVNFNCEFNEELMTLSTYYYKYEMGKETLMGQGETPTDAGSYRFVVKLELKKPTEYVFLNGQSSAEQTFDFDIDPQTINVSGLSFADTTLTYNGESRYPVLAGLSENVLTTSKLYWVDGTDPLDEAVDVGKYRCEVTLAAKNSNYVLSSREKYVVVYEIVPQEIDVSTLTVNTTEFTYNGQAQEPTFQNLPEYLNIKYKRFYRDYYSLTDGEQTLPISKAVNTGDYRMDVGFELNSDNYVLTGDTYSVEFVINKVEIDLNEILSNGIKLAYNKDGYANADIPGILDELMFGELSSYIEVKEGTLYDGDRVWISERLAKEKGEYIYSTWIEIIPVRDENDMYTNANIYNYVFVYDDRKSLGLQIDIPFIIE